MAAAALIFNEAELDQTTSLYDLYSRFYQGMRTANTVDTPDFTVNTPTLANGEVDAATINQQIANYTDILMKNSAYMMANSIISTVSGSGGGSGSGTAGAGFVSRHGDSMVGLLSALYGFEAGYQNQKIFDVTIDANEHKIAHVYGYLTVDYEATLSSKLNLSNQGIYFSNSQSIFYADNKLQLSSAYMKLTGDITVDGAIHVGANLLINQNGIFYNNYEFYHSGNSNNSSTDWNMRHGHVYGNLTVDGTTTLSGRLTAKYGFDLGENNTRLFYSVYDSVTSTSQILMNTDLSIVSGFGIKFADKYIVKVRGGADNVVSFSAPAMTMNLGDSDGNTATDHIALQTGIYNAGSDYRIISQFGDGNFPNSFSAGCGNAGSTVMQTYYRSSSDCGVVFQKNIRLGSSTGPNIHTNAQAKQVLFDIPYTHVVTVGNPAQTDEIPVSFRFEQTSSLFRDLSLNWSASLHLNTDGEFIVFDKPVEASSFSVISNTYKTRLLENTLFFADNTYLEGLSDGIRYAGNAYFTGNLSSPTFTSGFAGRGWAIMRSGIAGNIAATFDELTIRKKMRVYELEVQKISVTNGSLWVSDACSGDLVEELIDVL